MSADINEYGKSGGSGGGGAGETAPKANDASKSGASRSESEWINVLNRIIPPAGRGQAKHGVVLKKEAPQSSQFQAARKENRSRDLTAAWQGLAPQDAPFAKAPPIDKIISAEDIFHKPLLAKPDIRAIAAVERAAAESAHVTEVAAEHEKALTHSMVEPEPPAEAAAVKADTESDYLDGAAPEPEKELTPPVSAQDSFAKTVIENADAEPANVSEVALESEKKRTPPVYAQDVPTEAVVDESESSYLSVAVGEREEEPVIAAESFESGVVEVRGVNQDDDLKTRDDLMKKSKDSHGSVADSKTSKAMRDALVNQSHKTEAVERMVKSESRGESRDRKPHKEQARSLADIAATVHKKPHERDTSKEKEMKSKAAIEAMVGHAEQEESSERRSAGSSDKTIRIKVEPLGSGIVSVVTDSAKGVTKIGKSAVNSIGDAASSAREKIAGRSKDSSGGGKGAFTAAGETAAKATEAAADAVVSLFKGVGTLAGYVATGAVAAPVDLANGIANAVKGVFKSGKKDESSD